MLACSATLSRATRFALLAALVPGLTGCETSLTHKLWTSDEMRRFYEPAQNPHLELYQDPARGDVLAVYNETHETRDGIRRRAYYVNRDRRRVEAGHKPHFVDPRRASGLAAVPVGASSTPSHVTNETVQATVFKNGQSFALSGDFGGHDYGLPVYLDRRSVATRVLLTPVTVTGDAVLAGAAVGAVVGVWAAPLFLQGLSNTGGRWPWN